MSKNETALDEFTAYFVKNYPGDTIIHDPHWHAPRVFRAAAHALSRASEGAPMDADCLGYATRLLVSLMEKHYPDRSPEWAPLPDLYGVLTQIDNLSTGLSRASLRTEPVATHRHKKRGTEYALIGFGKMQASNWYLPGAMKAGPSVDMCEVAIYRSVNDGSLWARPREEFEDGRFEELPVAASPQRDAAESRVATLEAENAALIHDNARYVDAAAALATENERLRGALKLALDACDQGRLVERGAGGMTVEAQMKRSVINGVPAWPIEVARAALTGDPAKPEGESQ